MNHSHKLISMSIGEVVDRWLICGVKYDHTQDESVRKEMSELSQDLGGEHLDVKLVKELQALHQNLWAIEDEIRIALAHEDREAVFHLSKAIVDRNGRRSELKNLIGGKEVKSYGKHR